MQTQRQQTCQPGKRKVRGGCGKIKVSTLGQPAFIRRKGAMTKALRARSFAITLIFALSISAVACGGDTNVPSSAASGTSNEPAAFTSTQATTSAPLDDGGLRDTLTASLDDDTGEYEVQLGDTLSEIAERSGLSETEIAEINEIKNVDHIEVGDVLRIPSPTPSIVRPQSPSPTASSSSSPVVPTATPTDRPLHALAIDWLRQQEFQGSEIEIERTLARGPNYARFIASYQSDGLRIYAVFAVPDGEPPPGGWPVIVLNHGYIRPSEYRSTERYVAFVDTIARHGYIAFMPDYRGHGDSEGVATGGYGSPAYSIDVLNAVSSLKQYPDADASRIGMWGHSMGGQITLRSMVTSDDIKVGVIWAGVVAPYPYLPTNWLRSGSPPANSGAPVTGSRGWSQVLMEEFGSPEDNPDFWSAISPNSYLADISGPVQLHHSTTDTHVPLQFSEILYEQLLDADKEAEIFTYENDDHNISRNFSLAADRTISFFDIQLKVTR